MNEAKQMLIWKFTRVPIEKTYTFDWWTCPPVPNEPDQRYVEMRYVLVNDEKHNMGEFPLQFGKVRIFQKDGRGGEAFIGEDWGQFTPLDGEMKLYLGLARDIVVNRKITKNVRHPVKGNLFNQELVIQYTIENFKSSDLVLDIVEDVNRLRDQFCGRKNHDAEWQLLRAGTSLPGDQTKRKDSTTLECHIPLAAAPKGDGKVEPVVVTLHVMLKNEW